MEYFSKAIAVASRNNDCLPAEDRKALLAVTYNNMGCMLKSRGRLHASLSYLRKSLELESSCSQSVIDPGATCLNLCAILSKLGDHHQALHFARRGLTFMLKGSRNDDEEVGELAIAYHNLAVELEHLCDYPKAIAAFECARDIASSKWDSNHQFIQQVDKAIRELHKRVVAVTTNKP